MRKMQSGAKGGVAPAGQPAASEQSHLLKNGAPAHAFTREDRARGGHARAEMIRRRKELRDQLDGAELEDLVAAESELLDRALARLSLLIGSEDDRVALRAVKEVLDRTVGRPRQPPDYERSQGPDMETALVRAREKLVAALSRGPDPSVTPAKNGRLLARGSAGRGDRALDPAGPSQPAP
jgi:hypothetical protein